MSNGDAPSFDPRDLRNVLGTFVTGVTVVTTLDADGQLQGVTVNSFSSVSLEPPLVLWSQALSARSFAAFHAATRFVVNILAINQIELSRRFASGGDHKFDGVDIRPTKHGLPVLVGCAAHLECLKVDTYPGGDHAVYLGRIEAFHKTSVEPLAFGGGRYLMTVEHAHAHVG